MRKIRIYGSTLIFIILLWFPSHHRSWADGGYFSRSSEELVAVSADQRVIIIKNENEISMTFSTGYTGEGEDFGWLIPTPVPPEIEDVSEAEEKGVKAFSFLDEYTAPKIITYEWESGGRGCFPSGTEVLTAAGPRAIETVEPGTEVYSFDFTSNRWVLSKVLLKQSHQYEGDMITIGMGWYTNKTTGNHPFYVIRGDQLVSRPYPQDISAKDKEITQHGRWVEARDLKISDVLKDKSGEGTIITTLLSQYEKTEVFNLSVEDYRNYAVHQKGILVHNKDKGKGGEAISESAPLVTVYGTITMEHYEVSILGAADASALLEWLQVNGYQASNKAQDVLDTYIQKNWAFVAVKLNPGEQRHYENEFLTPLNIKYQYDELIFPLHISSVSTTQIVKIVIYVIAESTISSSNLPIATLQYEEYPSGQVPPEAYIETCISRTISSLGGRGLVTIWSGELRRLVAVTVWGNEELNSRSVIKELMKSPFSEGKEVYLTRLESRMGPGSMTEDIIFVPDPLPREFQVIIEMY